MYNKIKITSINNENNYKLIIIYIYRIQNIKQTVNYTQLTYMVLNFGII